MRMSYTALYKKWRDSGVTPKAAGTRSRTCPAHLDGCAFIACPSCSAIVTDAPIAVEFHRPPSAHSSG